MTSTPAVRWTARSVGVRAAAVLLAATSLVACSDGGSDGSPTTEPSDTTETTAAPAPTPSIPGSGDPRFTSFDLDSPVPCEDGNATVSMSYETENVDSIAISIDGGDFEETAGYGPDESDVVAEIPCTGAGEGTIALQGCNSASQCVQSDARTVEITS